jgi:hypothetical protein
VFVELWGRLWIWLVATSHEHLGTGNRRDGPSNVSHPLEPLGVSLESWRLGGDRWLFCPEFCFSTLGITSFTSAAELEPTIDPPSSSSSLVPDPSSKGAASTGQLGAGTVRGWRRTRQSNPGVGFMSKGESEPSSNAVILVAD